MIIHRIPGGRTTALVTFIVDDFGNETRSRDYDRQRMDQDWALSALAEYFIEQDH